MELPQEFTRRLKRLPGGLLPAMQAAYAQPLRRGLRVNTLKISPDRLRALFPQPLTPSPFSPLSFYADAPFKAGGDPLHHAGAYYMQEPSAASAVTVLAPRPGEKILDLCAAPGGRLVYSTCTFAPEEDELAVARFLNRHPEFVLEPIEVSWGCPGFPAEALTAFGAAAGTADLTGCRRIFPHQGGEGHFIAHLRKAEDAPGDSPAPYAAPARDAHREEARTLYEACFSDTPVGTFVTVGDTVRLLPPELPALKGTGTLAAGLAVAEVCKNRLEPCHAAFAAAHLSDCRQAVDLDPADPVLAAFLHGAEIPADTAGYTAVAAAGIPLGFGKVSAGRLKNRYPKGLRLL